MSFRRLILVLLSLTICWPASADVNVRGQLINAQLEKLSADPTGSEARIFWDSDDNLFRVYDGSAWLSIADLTRAQTLSSKTLASPTVTGTLLLQNPSGAQPELAFSEDPDNGTAKVTIKAVADQSGGDYTLTLPPDDGDSGEVLGTNGSGVLDWVAPLTNPMDSEGDLIVGGAAGAATKLDSGVKGQRLTAQGAASPAWQFGSVHTVSDDDYTITDTDGYDLILISTGAASNTVTLPTVADNDYRRITIKKTDSGVGTLIVEGEGSETIDDGLNFTMWFQYDFVTLVSDGAEWWVVDYNADSVWIDWDAEGMTFFGFVTGDMADSKTLTASYRRSGSSLETFYYYRHTVATGSAAGSGNYQWIMPRSLSVNAVLGGSGTPTAAGNVGSASITMTSTGTAQGSLYYGGSNSVGVMVVDETSVYIPSNAGPAWTDAAVRITWNATIPITEFAHYH